MTTPASGKEKGIRADFPALSNENDQKTKLNPEIEFAQGLPEIMTRLFNADSQSGV